MFNFMHKLSNNDFMYVNKYTFDFDFNTSNKKNEFYKFYDLNEYVFEFKKKL